MTDRTVPQPLPPSSCNLRIFVYLLPNASTTSTGHDVGAGEPWWDLRECLDRGWIDRAWLADRAALERSGVDA